MMLDIKNDTIKEYLNQAEFGIEREGLRICSDGRLAQSPHPFESNKNIDRDFCENQVELISDVFIEPKQVNALAEQILDLCRQGLIERGYGEEIYLSPLYERVEKRTNSAQTMLTELESGIHIDKIIKEYGR